MRDTNKGSSAKITVRHSARQKNKADLRKAECANHDSRSCRHLRTAVASQRTSPHAPVALKRACGTAPIQVMLSSQQDATADPYS